MTAGRELVVTLGGLHGTVHPPDAPFLRADDPLLSRGDGVFETVLLRDGRPGLLEQHLTRLIASAELVGLPARHPDAWRTAVAAAVAAWPEPGEAVLRLCHGRGAAGSVSFVMVSPLPERIVAARRDGISVVTLDRGPVGDARPGSAGAAGPAEAAGAAGSALSSAKSSSYAVHVAALREAARRGADDAVYLDADGYVLEGPRSSVLVQADGQLLTPPPSLPILPGTTVQALFATAAERGVPCTTAMLRRADLLTAQGVWLLSSLTLAARVHTLDGVVLPAPSAAVRVADLVAAATGGAHADDG